MQSHPVALAVFCVLFVLVTLAGFLAGRWRRPEGGMDSLEEWGLAGRSFGTWLTWFLVGGDLYSAYTVIAVPALLYGTGAMGFFALPYVTLAYPYMMAVMPRIWGLCHRNGYVTLADLTRGLFGYRPLTIAVAVTGLLALMPYIALQLVGMRVALAALGLSGELPLVIAFVLLAAYTYTAGLRAPAIIAIAKDIMLWTMVLAATVVMPFKLGGYPHIFAAASAALALHKPAGSLLLRPGQTLPYATLAIGSTIGLMLYPHTATAVLSARSEQVIRRNAALLPAYSLLLGLLALLGYGALAADIHITDTSSAVPMLFLRLFPDWFAGFCLAAVAVGALVPAAIMSIAAANLFTRNLLGELRHTPLTPREESAVAKVVSLAAKFAALLFVLKLPAPYAIEMQLLGGLWIVQIFPAVVLGSFFTRHLHPVALLVGWLAGMVSGTAMALSMGLKSSVYPLHLFGQTLPMFAAVPALVLNLALGLGLSLVLPRREPTSTVLANVPQSS